MATLVCFHAHPDDESITTGGTMARAAAEGHRVVLVVATDGRHGEVPDDLARARRSSSAAGPRPSGRPPALGVARIEWLGYEDSGMTGWAQNDDDGSFLRADLDEAAERLAAVLREERADVLTTYDWHGNYGHPDHIKVHRSAIAPPSWPARPTCYEATMNRDAVVRMIEAAGRGEASAASSRCDFDAHEHRRRQPVRHARGRADDGRRRQRLPRPEAGRRSSPTAARSPTRRSSSQMPPEVFAIAFGTEWFIRKGAPAGIHETLARRPGRLAA